MKPNLHRCRLGARVATTRTAGRAAPSAPSADTLEYAYQYDDIGNRITSTDLGTNRTYTANSLNQYSAITTSDLGLQTSCFEPQFDDDGNQTLIQTATGIWQVQYNGENRPVLWTGGTQSATTNIVMSFDRMGRRVEYLETVGGSQSSATETNAYHRFVYDNYLCIQRLDAANDNAVDLAFVWDVTELVATRPLVLLSGTVPSYYTHDGSKNVTMEPADRAPDRPARWDASVNTTVETLQPYMKDWCEKCCMKIQAIEAEDARRQSKSRERIRLWEALMLSLP